MNPWLVLTCYRSIRLAHSNSHSTSLVIPGYWWLYLFMLGYTWLLVVMGGYTWLCLIIPGYAWLLNIIAHTSIEYHELSTQGGGYFRNSINTCRRGIIMHKLRAPSNITANPLYTGPPKCGHPCGQFAWHQNNVTGFVKRDHLVHNKNLEFLVSNCSSH